MGITQSKTNEVLRVVHIDDDDVDAHDDEQLGWISMTPAEVRPGVQCPGISPSSQRVLMAADGDLSEGSLNAGVAAYGLAIAGLMEVGDWQAGRLKWRALNRETARDLVETLNVPAAIWQLGALVRRLSGGWSPDEEADLIPLPQAAAGSGREIAG